jgi:hypothetical protein
VLEGPVVDGQVDVVLHERHEHEDAPDADDHRRHGGERSTIVSTIAGEPAGAYSALKIATPIAGKNERASAATLVISVPRMKGQVPWTPVTGFQVVPVRNPSGPKVRSGRRLSLVSTQTMSRASAMIEVPSRTTIVWKIRSPSQR